MESFYGTAMISMQPSGSSGRYSEVRGVGLRHRGPNPGAYLASAKNQWVDSTYLPYKFKCMDWFCQQSGCCDGPKSAMVC
jgi:hypothetical protein